MSEFSNLHSENEGEIVDFEHALANNQPMPQDTPEPQQAAQEPTVTEQEPQEAAPVEEPSEPEAQEEIEAAPEEEEPDELVALDEEPPDGLSQGASKRFQTLANRAKAAEEKANKLEEALAQLAQAQSKQLEIQEEAWGVQKSAFQRQEEARRREIVQRQLEEAGWDLNDPIHKMVLEERAERENLQNELAAMREEAQARRQEALVAQWENSIDQVLRTKLANYDVKPNQLVKFRNHALKIAAAEELTSASAAVEAVLDPVQEFLRPKGAKKKAAPLRGVQDSDKKAFEAMASGSRTTSQPAKVQEQEFEDLENEMFPGGGWRR